MQVDEEGLRSRHLQSFQGNSGAPKTQQHDIVLHMIFTTGFYDTHYRFLRCQVRRNWLPGLLEQFYRML